MAAMTITKTLFLKAPPEHVWKFLTDKQKLSLWFYEGAESIEGEGPYQLNTNTLGKEGDRVCWGDVSVFEPPKKLVHTFTHDFLQGVETTCVWTLTGVEGGTILLLEHSGFENVNDDAFGNAADHDKGWDEHFIRLRRVTL